MKKVKYILILILFTSFTIQSSFYDGIYEYKSDRFYERITLGKDFKFKYDFHWHNISYSLNGNYIVKGDSLILDSNPQRDKLIVRESKKGNANNLKFCINDKLGEHFNYSLHLINKNKDTLNLCNQWKSSKIKGKKIESFYITDSKGLKTPLYPIKGIRTNYFEIQMETIRVFDNEVWKMNSKSIRPKGMDGENQDYKLEKTKSH